MEKLNQNEINRRWGNLVTFLNRVQNKYPDLATQFPKILTKLLGPQTFDPALMQQNKDKLGIGMSILGDWLRDSQFGGFAVNLSLTEKAVKQVTTIALNLPTRDRFFRDSGVAPESWNSLNLATAELSTTLREVVECGNSPAQIVAGLFIESVRNSPNGSSLVFDQINSLSGGRVTQVSSILENWLSS